MYQRITERCLKLAIMAGANAANNAIHIVVERCTSHGSMTSSFMRQPLPTGAPSFDRTARRNEGSIRLGPKRTLRPFEPSLLRMKQRRKRRAKTGLRLSSEY
jgi:hypothetical protein